MPMWTSYFYTGSIAIIISWVLTLTLSGCRFGNRIEEAAKSDTTSGYYATQAQTYQLFATVSSQTQSASANPSHVPEMVSENFSNPAGFQVLDASTGESAIFQPVNPQTYFPVFLASDKKAFSSNLTYKPLMAWDDPACIIRQSVEISGTLAPLGNTSPTTVVGGSTVSLSGRIQTSVHVEQVFDGACSASLQAMRACYENVSQCQGGSDSANEGNHDYVAQFFSGPIDAGIMSSSDIENVSNVAYEVTYE